MKYSHLVFFAVLAVCNSDIVTYYEEGIEKQINESIAYTFPPDASEYKPSNSDELIDYGIFDFIIVGAGSTGSVIAERLSEILKWKILLLDPGDFTTKVVDVPNMLVAYGLSNYTWGYRSIPQTTACLDSPGNRCFIARGKGIGGTGIINGIIYARGHKVDFDNWAKKGNPGWSYNEVLPYFKKSENLIKNVQNAVVDMSCHGTGGLFNVEYSTPTHPMTQAFLKGNKDLGYESTDYNCNKMGVSPPQINTKHGVRVEGGNTYIKPVLDRPNLTVLTKSFVTKILIGEKTKTATGVLFTRDKKSYVAKVRKQVILSAGGIDSPKLLMLSGVGPKRDLDKLGIPTISNLQVGQSLIDHTLYIGLQFSTNLTIPEKTLKEYVEEYLRGTGSLTFPNTLVGLGFYKTKYAKLNSPDLELMVFSNDGFVKILKTKLSKAKEKTNKRLITSNFAVYLVGLYPKSTGTVKLRSKNPFDYALIDPRFLSDRADQDINTLYEGIKFVLQLIKTEPFARLNTTLVNQDVPECNKHKYLSKPYWTCLLRQFTSTNNHPMGTCPMGPNPKNGDVVDSNCNVHGVKQLKVADASIFPFSFSGHPNAVCNMIGEKLSDKIIQEFRK